MATATIGKWGNASAVRLPKSFCDILRVSAGDSVHVFVEDDRRIVIEPASDGYTLKERMRGWNGGRYHSEELDWGTPMGDELW